VAGVPDLDAVCTDELRRAEDERQLQWTARGQLVKRQAELFHHGGNLAPGRSAQPHAMSEAVQCASDAHRTVVCAAASEE
jgi:hypothetical protein